MGRARKEQKMQGILISKKKDKKIIALLEDGNLQEVYEEKEDSKRLEGNIYLGKVKDILPRYASSFCWYRRRKKYFYSH